MSNELQIKIEYCRSCNFQPIYNSLKSLILEKFPNAKIKGVRKNGTNGEFEIFVNEKLIHSKLKGQGIPDENDVIKKILKCK